MASPREIPASHEDVDPEIQDFTRALSKGCENSWARFFDTYHRRLRGYLQACWQGDCSAVDDLVQETLLRAVRHMRTFESEAALWSWLTVLARSATRDHGRRTSTWRRFLEKFQSQSFSPAPADDHLENARKKLAPAEARLLELKYDENRTVSEMATLLKISPKAVESRLTRARRKLRKIYQSLES